MQRSTGSHLAISAGAFVLLGILSLLSATGQSDLERDEVEIVALASRWASAVAGRDPGLVDLLTASSVAHYEGLRNVAFRGDVSALDALGPTDQLQALFLRLTIHPSQLQRMTGREILMQAVREHLIGQALRRTDDLREVIVKGDEATGRLYKFGRDDRPDRGQQYFVRESGEWRVDLRGEHERLSADFESFVTRSGLAPSEAAFFILETRLLRKVTPTDFIPPASHGLPEIGRDPGANAPPARTHLRVVAVRESPDDPDLKAVTIEDRRESLRSVLRVGDSLKGETGPRLVRVDGDQAFLVDGGASLVLHLDPHGPALDQRLRVPGGPTAKVSLLEQARLGENRTGLMAQWRNVGLRGRPQLLQQASLVPEILPASQKMMGLRVRKLVKGSFWQQLGLSEGDLLERVNGNPIDSMNRWQALMRVAETDQEISLVLRRDGRRLRFRTRTVPPRGSAEAA